MGTSFKRAVVLAVVVVVAAGSTGAARATSPLGGTGPVGEPGIGDPYYPRAGNGGYQVSHYDIDVRYAVAPRRISGTTTVTAQADRDLTRFNLDLALPATAVRVGGVGATFQQRGSELRVTPASTWTAGSEVDIEVVYRGRPAAIADAEIRAA